MTGGKKKLSQIQDSYITHLQNKGIELKRGVRNSKATHQTLKQYYTAINQSHADCKNAGIIPPSDKPAEFNVWQQTIHKLTESLNKSDDRDFEKLSNIINELVATNKRLQEELTSRQSRPHLC
jgi:hypothetical protein